MPTLSSVWQRTAAIILGLVALPLVLAGCAAPDNLIDGLRNPLAWGPCGLIIIILDVIALVEIVNSRKSTSSKLIWSLIVVFFPLGGLILYHFFGKE
ncbi:MAG: PLD nuclease N-terminal domain-containing protein [Bacteroidota bacterium]